MFPGPGSEFDGTDSFIFWGAQNLYGLPDALNGIISGESGLLPGSGIQIIPDAVTNFLGGGLNDLIGPQTALAEGIASLNTQLMTGIYSALDVIAPGVIDFGQGGGITADALSAVLPDLSAMLAPMLAGNLGDLANPLNFIDPMMFLSMF